MVRSMWPVMLGVAGLVLATQTTDSSSGRRPAKLPKSGKKPPPVVCKGCSLPSPGGIDRCNYCGASLYQAFGVQVGLILLAGLGALTAFAVWASSVPDPFDSGDSASVKPFPTQVLPTHLNRQAEESAPSPFVSRQIRETATGEAAQNAPVQQNLSSKAQPARPNSKLTCGGYRTDEPDRTEFGPYIQRVQKLLRQQWHPPKSLQNQLVKVGFAIACDGKILQPHILRTSGFAEMDHAALAALSNASPLPLLPETYQGRYVNVEFEFDFQVDSRQSHSRETVSDKSLAPDKKAKKKAGL